MAIPFIGGETDYQKTIDRIIELERLKLTRIETRVSAEELKLSGLRDVKSQAGSVNSILRQLAGINSAFRDIKGISSDAKAVEAFINTNDRRVQSGQYALQVKEVAKKHIIASKPIFEKPKQPPLTLPEGTITFMVTNEPYAFTFNGGAITDFVSAINEDATLAKAVQATTVKRRELESVIVLTAKEPGKQNAIRIKKDKKNIMRQLRLFKRNPPLRIPLVARKTFADLTSAQQLNESDVGGYRVIELPPKSRFEMTVDRKLNFTTIKNLSFYFKIIPDSTITRTATPAAPTSAEKTAKQANSPPVLTAILEYTKGDEATEHKALIKTSDIFFNLALIDAYSLTVVNSKKITVKKLTFTNTSLTEHYAYSAPVIEIIRTNRDPLIPVKTLQKAADATVLYQGLEVKRPSNSIDDLVPGVTFRIKRPTTEPIDIAFEQDTASILTSMTNFISAYNTLVEVLNIYLSPNEDSLGSADLNETYSERIGILNGDFNLGRLKLNLRSLVTRPYPTARGNDLIFYSQVGIEPIFTTQSVYNITNGKINFVEDTFTAALETHGGAVGDLFSYDTNDDGLPDTGLVIELERILDSYLDRRGILTLQESNLNTNLKRLRADQTREEERLDTRRAKLEEDFSQVEALQNSQESVRSWLDSLNNN